MRKKVDAKFHPCEVRGKRIVTRNQFGLRSYRIVHPFLVLTGEPNGLRPEDELQYRKDQFRDLVDAESWSEAIRLIREKRQFEYLKSIQRDLTDRDFYTLLRQILTSSQSLRSVGHPLKRYFSGVNHFAIGSLWMTNTELRFLKGLPLRSDLQVWRGTGDGSHGWAWTTSEEVARWYAARYAERNPSHQGIVLKGVVNKNHIVAAFLESPKGHGTLIINPDNVHLLKTEVVGSLCLGPSPEQIAEQERLQKLAERKAKAALKPKRPRRYAVEISFVMTETGPEFLAVAPQR